MIDNSPTLNLFGPHLSRENQCNAKIKLTKTCKQRKPVGKEKISVTKRVRKFK